MGSLLIIAGFVYLHGTTTPIEGAVVSVRNLTSMESHNGSESSFSELTTNSAGEWQVNLANFTEDYTEGSNGDVIEISVSYGGKMDYTRVTLDGTDSFTNIVLTPVSEVIYDIERAFEEIGSKVNVYQSSVTLETDYDSVSVLSTNNHVIDDDIYAVVQIGSDEESMVDQGIMSQGYAKGWFKVRYNIHRGDKIATPTDTDHIWLVIDKPVRHYFNNEPNHDEARLVRIESAIITGESGTLVPSRPYPGITQFKTGASCSGNDGATSRVLTISTPDVASNAKVFLDGLRLIETTHYSIVYGGTLMTITFVLGVWNDQTIAVDYTRGV